MKHRRALELFFLKAKEEFERRKKSGEAVGLIIYHGCDFTDGNVRLRGTHVVSRNFSLPENHTWEDGVEVFRSIMKDMTE